MVKKVLGLLVLILVMTGALVAYSMTADAPDLPGIPGTVSTYKKEVFAKVKEVAAPVLKKAGFDVEKVPDAKDLNVVEKQMENASEKINEATKAFGGQ